MLIPVIEFEMRDPNTGLFEEYVIENTANNQELVAFDSRTRGIRYRRMFDFQFEKATPPTFIQFGNAVLEALGHCLDNGDEGIEYGDQMA